MRNKLYVKLPLYVADYLRWKYRSSYDHTTIVLPSTMHKAGSIIYKHAVSNPFLKPITTLSYSHRAMNISKEFVPREMKDGIPTEYSRKFMIPFELPEGHIIYGRYVEESDCMQLTEKHAREFRRIVIREMWDDIVKFRESEWNDWARTMNYHINDFANMLGCWMQSRDINQDHYEIIMRVYRREQYNKGLTTKYKPRN